MDVQEINIFRDNALLKAGAFRCQEQREGFLDRQLSETVGNDKK